MIEDRNIDFRAGIQIGLLIASSFISTVTALLLMCLLSVPVAWLSAALGFSTTTFLVLSAPAVAISIATTLRMRVGERLVGALASLVAGRVVDIGHINAVTRVSRTWNELQHLYKAGWVEWTELEKQSRSAREEVTDFERAVAEHEDVVRKLQRWSAPLATVSMSVMEVSAVLRRQQELQDQIRSYANNILDRYEEVSQDYQELLRDEGGREARRVRLMFELREAESSVPPTFWAWVENIWRKLWIMIYERWRNALRAEPEAWLATRFDPTPDVRRQSEILRTLGGRTIRCTNGEVAIQIVHADDIGADSLLPLDSR